MISRHRGILISGIIVVAAVIVFDFFHSTENTIPVIKVRSGPFQQRITAEGVLEAVRSTPMTAPPRKRGRATIAWMIDDGIFVNQGGVIVRFDPMEQERDLVEGEVELFTAQSKLQKSKDQGEANLVDVERDRRLAEFELDMARNFSTKDPDIFSRIEIIEAQIDEELTGFKLEHAEGREKIQERLAATEMDLFNIDRDQAEVKIREANEALNALEVRAPHDGIVIFVRDWRGNIKQVGDTVYSRQPIAELPALDIMKAEIFVLEADAGGLKEGLQAELVVEASSERTFSAVVRYVDRMPKPRIRNVPVQYFAVTLALKRTDHEIMKPGQRVRATLNLMELDDAIVVPRNAVFEKKDRTLVYRQDGLGFEEVEVRLGPSSLGRVVLEDGVADGDMIALRDPSLSDPKLLSVETDDKDATIPVMR